MQAIEALSARDAEVTIQFQDSMLCRGLSGQLAFGLFRAYKNSSKAKEYRRGAWRRGAYGVKNDSIDYVDALLTSFGEHFDVKWGWGKDNAATNYEHVLYVDLLGFGQVSFHSSKPSSDKRYYEGWSGIKNTGPLIASFCDSVMKNAEIKLGPDDLMFFGKHIGKPLKEIDEGYLDYLRGWSVIRQWTCLHAFLNLEGAKV